MTRWTLFTFVILAAMLSIAADVFVATASAVEAPTTAPVATTGPSEPIIVIQKWFDDLASADSETREDARQALLGLPFKDLDALREVVRRSAPLAASQAAVLHDIVLHVYLSGEQFRYTPDPRQQGFLGVKLSDPSGIVMIPDDADNTSPGVLILECMPGFCGFRWLQAGDLVDGVIGAVPGEEPMRIASREALIATVAATSPGSVLNLQVVRQGRVIEVPVRVNAKPIWASDLLQTDQRLGERRAAAENYWQERFAALAGGNLS